MQKTDVQVVFIVRSHNAQFHYSTDAYIGTVSRIEEAFGSYIEALDYITAIWGDNMDADSHASISMDVTYELDNKTYGHEYAMHELHVNSFYKGPRDHNDPWCF